MKSGLLKKSILVFSGSLSLALGIFGLFIPVLPTTPFLLLAAFCYLRSSEKLYNWLMHHRVFGEYISNYMLYKAVKKRVKIGAVIFLWCSLGISIFLIDSLHVDILLCIVGIAVSIHIFKLKTINNKHYLERRMTKMSEKKVFTTEQAREWGGKLDIDWTKFDVEQFRMGMDVELEHGSRDPQTNVTSNDPLTTAKIALAHLKEFPDYYTRLEEMEDAAEAYWKDRM